MFLRGYEAKTQILTHLVSENPSPNPNTLVNNRTFADEAAALYAQRPAQGPYTVGLGNNAVYIGLPNITNTTHILAAIQQQLSTSSWAAYLPPGTDAAVERGYETQLRIVAANLARPDSPVFESFWGPTPSSIGWLLTPLSRGSVQLNTSHPDAPPVLDYRTASNPADIAMLAAFVPLLQKYLQTPSMRALGVKELEPGPQNDDLVAYIRKTANPTGLHPCCTASMLPRLKGGVVDTQLKVYGVAGLRVVDASVFPIIPGTHLSATVYAVAEKAADIIVKQWANEKSGARI